MFFLIYIKKYHVHFVVTENREREREREREKILITEFSQTRNVYCYMSSNILKIFIILIIFS